MKEKVVVLFSGGQDSTTCLMWAIKKFGQAQIVAVSFNYGQKHVIELQQARLILDLFPMIKHKVFDLKDLLPESALTNHDLDVSGQSSINPELPASFTAGRNILFLTIAGSYAVSIGAKVIVTGVCQTDYSGYPDCRQVFIDSMEQTLNRGLIASEDAFEENRIMILTPLMNLTKAQTWKLAKSFGTVDGYDPIDIIRDLTMTDYNGDMTWNDWGRGKLDNPASILRAKGYRDAVAKGWI